MQHRFSFHLFLSLLFAFTFTACDSDENGNGNGNGGTIGDADVTISGDLEGSFSGGAAFGFDPDDPESGFGIAIFEGALAVNPTGEFVVLGGTDGDRPEEGTYAINNEGSGDTYIGVYTTDASATTGGTFVFAQSGTLTITSSSSDRLVGSFSFTGPVLSPNAGAEDTATVAGTFDADFVEESDFPPTP